MDSFWSKLLILGIVAAIGLFFIGNVYMPQKAAQEAMADSAQQSVNAVKAGVEDSTPKLVTSSDVTTTVEQYCKSGNTVPVIVRKTATLSYTFKTSNTTSESATPSGTANATLSSIVVASKNYLKTINKNGALVTSIEFVEQ